MTRMALFFGLLTPKRLTEQTNSQILQPEHLSGTTANFQDMFFSSVASLSTINSPCQEGLHGCGRARRTLIRCRAAQSRIDEDQNPARQLAR